MKIWKCIDYRQEFRPETSITITFFKPERSHDITEVKNSKTKSVGYNVGIFSSGNTF